MWSDLNTALNTATPYPYTDASKLRRPTSYGDTLLNPHRLRKFADKVMASCPPISGPSSPEGPWTEYALGPELLKDGAERRRGAARPGARP